MCDELDRQIEIKQYYAGSLSPCFVKFGAEGLGVASSVRLVGPIIEAFVRPRAILDSDDGLCFYFSIDESRADRVKLEIVLNSFQGTGTGAHYLSKRRAGSPIEHCRWFWSAIRQAG